MGWIGLAVDTKEESPALLGVWIYSGVPGPPCQAPSGGHGEDGLSLRGWMELGLGLGRGWGWRVAVQCLVDPPRETVRV